MHTREDALTPHPQIDRTRLKIRPLSERRNLLRIEDEAADPASPPEADDEVSGQIGRVAERVARSRGAGRPVVLAYGAHAIKNGLAPVLIQLAERGWVTHLATNGAGIIHDWEFAFQGHSSEDVRGNVARGEFGAWEESGFNINLAIVVGAYRGLGYGESVGALVDNDGIEIPSDEALREEIVSRSDDDPGRDAAAADLLEVVRAFGLKPGWLQVSHPFKRFGLQAAAYRLNVPFTSHPMIGHDIIYVHPMNHCGAIGRAAQRDFLRYASSVSRLDGGVYMSIGSAVMSPMIFEKSLSMAQNLAIQRGGHMDDHFIVVVDLQESHWDWSQGEPPMDNPDYYLRYNKTFNRMGGAMRYLTADNRDFLLAVLRGLESA